MEVIMSEEFIPVVFFGFVYLVIKLILDNRWRHKLLEQSEINEGVQKMYLEKTASSSRGMLKWGITLTCIGVAFFVGRLFNSEQLTLSLIFLMAGLGLVGYYFIETKVLDESKNL